MIDIGTNHNAKNNQNAPQFSNHHHNILISFISTVADFISHKRNTNYLFINVVLLQNIDKKLNCISGQLGVIHTAKMAFWVENDIKMYKKPWDITKLISHKGNAVENVLIVWLTIWNDFLINFPSLAGQWGDFGCLKWIFELFDFLSHLSSIQETSPCGVVWNWFCGWELEIFFVIHSI